MRTARFGLIFGIVLVTGLVQPCHAGTFYDDFSDGNMDGWFIAHNGNMGTGGYAYGHWYVQDQTLVQDDPSDHFAAVVPYVITSDQTIEADITPYGYAGIRLWHRDAWNFVSVIIYPSALGIWVAEKVDGEWDPYPYYQHPVYTWGGQRYRLRVEAKTGTGQVAVYLDDVYLFTYQATTQDRRGQSGVTSGNGPGYFHNIRVTSDTPAIDIMPGSTENRINLKKAGGVSVAILSTENFDALVQVDRTSLTFGRTGDEASFLSCSKRPKDVNHDGLLDLVCSFSVSAAGFQADDTQGVLKGRTTLGLPFTSADLVTPVSRR